MNYTAGIVVLASIGVDIITGLLAAVATKTFKSSTMRAGAWHKIGEILMVCILYGIEIAMPLVGLDYNIPFVEIGTVYLLIMEIGSVLENIVRMSPHLSNFADTLMEKVKGGKGKDAS